MWAAGLHVNAAAPVNRPGPEEHEVRLLLLSAQRGRSLPSTPLAAHRVLQVPHRPRLRLAALCTPHHHQRQRARWVVLAGPWPSGSAAHRTGP